jgi:uncharacterized repeat protein (TIGR01451 family)
MGSYNPTTGVWTVGTVTTSAPYTLLLFAKVVSPQQSTNSASISHADQFDPNLANNQASALVTPQHADLYLAKTVDNPTPHVGDTITFTITLTNLGSDAATNVVVKDLLPAGLAFVSAIASEGVYDHATGIWSVGTVAPGTPQTLQISATVIAATPATNTTAITHSDQFDPDLSNNTGRVTVTPKVPTADLVLSKTVSMSQVFVGSTVTFTLVIRNLGPDLARSVVVSDPFPPGLVFVSADPPSQGSYDPATGTWTVGNLGFGVVATLRVTARVTALGTLVNTARATSTAIDPMPANNVSSVFVIGLNPASGISKRVFLAR